MYGNQNFPMNNLDNINRQINELERLRQNLQAPQQPIQNIINTNTPQIDFEARFLNENDNVEEILVQRKTAFISPKNGYLKIKDVNGDITTYELIVPKTPEQLKIEELERRLERYEQSNDRTNNESSEQGTDNNELIESTTKNVSRTVFKKS